MSCFPKKTPDGADFSWLSNCKLDDKREPRGRSNVKMAISVTL
jgi:hypothetical protein